MAAQAQEVFWLSSADCQQLLYVSPAFETIWGRPIESLYSYPGGFLQFIVDTIHPDDRERIVADGANLLQQEYKAEYRIVQPDGSRRWVRSRSFPIKNSFGDTWAIAGLSEDITERKQDEELLDRREQEFRALVENSPDIIFRLDRELRHLYVNPAVVQTTGIPLTDYFGKTNRELGIPEVDVLLWEQFFRRIFQTGQEDDIEFNFNTPSGFRYYQSRVVPEFAMDGSVESILGICRDITQTKQTEAVLRESEACFRTVFEFAPIGMAIVNSQGSLVRSNPTFQDILGYSTEELQNLSFREFIHPNDQRQSVKWFRKLLTGQCHRFSLEQRYLRKDGRVVWGNVAVSSLYEADGAFQYAILMLKDITLQKQAELERQEAYAELERRVAERTAELLITNARLKQEIVERQKAQEELKAQKEFLQTIIDINPNEIFVRDRLGQYVLANQVCASFHGTTVEDLLGKTLADYPITLDDVERFYAQDQEVMNTAQQLFIPEQLCRDVAGELRWFQTIKRPIFADNGQVKQVLGVSTDITERKLAEEQLRAVLDAVPGFISWISADGRYLGVNRHLAEHFNLAPNTFVGQELGFLKASPEFVQFTEQFLASSVQTECWVIETQVRNSTRKYLIAAQKYNQDKMAVVVGIDITERLQAEVALQSQKDFLQAVIDTNPNCIYVKDTSGKYVLSNQAHANCYGVTFEQVQGKTDAEFNPHSADIEQFIAQDQEVLITARQKIISEEACHTSTGELRWFQTIKKPLFSSQGQVTLILGVSTDITEHKLVEEKLQQSEARLRQALEAARMGFWDWNLQTGKIGGSLNLEQVYGWPSNLFNSTHDKFLDIVHPEDRDRFHEANQRALATGEDCDIEFRVILPDGSIRWIESKGQVIYDDTGNPLLMTGIDVDITERKQVQLALNVQKDFLQNLVDTNPNMIFVKDASGKYVLVNQAFADFFGKTVEEVLGKTRDELCFNPTNTERFLLQDQEVLIEQQILVLEEACYTRTGKIRWYHTIKKPLCSSNGQVCHIFGVSTDITQIKQAEEQLQESESRLRQALEAARMGFWDWDLQTGNVNRSHNLESLYGLDFNSGNNSIEHFYAIIHPEDQDYVRQLDQCFIETGKDGDAQFRIILPDGSIRWIESKGQVIYHETGKPVRMTGIDVDITERKQAEEQIQASLREKNVLLQEIHHRVKNNLQVISSLLDLQSQRLPDQTTQELFRESQTRVRSMALIHEKLYQSQDCANINFAEYVSNLTSYLFQVYAVNAANITLELDIADITLNINTAIPCGLIINELISNILKYAFLPSTQGKITIALYAEANKNFTLVIKDNGIGLPLDLDLATVKTLGLQLVQVLIDQIQGNLEIQRCLGTEFKISFSMPN